MPALTGNRTLTPSPVTISGAPGGGARLRPLGSAEINIRVYGCRGSANTDSVSPVSDQLAVRHDAHAVGHALHDAEVVGDQQDRHAETVPETAEQSQDLRLHGHVEGRGRLVGDQQLRLVGQGHGDHDALALPPGELVGISVESPLRVAQADEVKQFQCAFARRPGLHAPVDEQDSP